MTKTIMILAIAVAFVAGSMITGTIAFAAPGDQGKPFEALQAQIDSIPIGDSDWTISGSDMFSAVSGNVGIGTATPSQLLTLENGGSPRVFVTDTSSGVTTQIGAQDGAGFMGTFTTTDLRILTGNDERMRITTDGKVGIGTTTPNSKLEVTNGYIELDTSSGTPPSGDCDASNEIGRMIVDSSNNNLYVCTNNGWQTK